MKKQLEGGRERAPARAVAPDHETMLSSTQRERQTPLQEEHHDLVIHVEEDRAAGAGKATNKSLR
eukprot:752854-Hanusia_phi.AAC.3